MAAKDADDRKPDDQDAEISLDMSQTAVKKMISEARDKGYITYDSLSNRFFIRILILLALF